MVKGEHSSATGPGGLKELDAEGHEEWQQALGVEDEGYPHVVGDGGREVAVEAEPDEALNELMDGKEGGEGGEEEFAAMLDLGEGGYAERAEDAAAYEVRCC